MERGDDRAAVEPEAVDGGGELVETRRQLQVDVEPDARCLVDEERECLLERRQLGCHLAELGERALAHRAVGGPVAHLVEPVGVGQDERSAWKVEDVELDEVDAVCDRLAEGAERVLRSEVRGSAMTDPEHRAVAAVEIDHAGPLPALRDHHHASGARARACATVIAAARRETSCQNRSG